MSEYVEGFDSLESMVEEMRRREEWANQQVTQVQWDIGWGDYWAREVQMGPETVAIVGYVLTEQETEDQERDAGAEEWEIADETQALREAHERGYRFGWAYSEIEPHGELGSTHVLNMAPISREEFEQCRELEFRTVEMQQLPWWGQELLRRVHG